MILLLICGIMLGQTNFSVHHGSQLQIEATYTENLDSAYTQVYPNTWIERIKTILPKHSKYRNLSIKEYK